LEVVYGGGDVGKFLCENPKIDSIHLTGAAATFDAIVWGTDNPKKARDSLLTPILSLTSSGYGHDRPMHPGFFL
jgi:hypothetical protein